ncbi:hypothetical protein RZS08_49490, partial [Arthrospira platensis SPKY1]|nr:hypothetical protein [Arthrospira platensis SPKY1]
MVVAPNSEQWIGVAPPPVEAQLNSLRGRHGASAPAPVDAGTLRHRPRASGLFTRIAVAPQQPARAVPRYP